MRAASRVPGQTCREPGHAHVGRGRASAGSSPFCRPVQDRRRQRRYPRIRGKEAPKVPGTLSRTFRGYCENIINEEMSMKICVVHVNAEKYSGSYTPLISANFEKAKAEGTTISHRFVQHLKRATDTVEIGR